MWLGQATLSSANGLQAVCRHQKCSFNSSVFTSGISLSSLALPGASCSWSWLSNNDCQPFKRAPVSNAVKAREAEGKAEICGSLQGFYCESETRKGICTVQCR